MSARVARGGWAVAVLAAAVVAASIRFGYYDLFSAFRPYDDEGHMLLVVKLVLDGHALYDQVFTPYGPCYFLAKWVVHAGLGVPLTNDAVRLLALAQWMLLCGLCAASVRRATGSWLWATVAYGALFGFLKPFHNEPGHPQELVALLAAALPLTLWSARPQRAGRWFAGGVLTGLLLASKVNAGFFALAALATLLCAELPARRGAAALRAAAVLGAVLAPLLLMRPLLAEAACRPYALVCSAALGAATLAGLGRRAAPERGWLRAGLACAAGVAVASGGVLVLAAALGATPGGLVRSLVHYAGSARFFYFFPSFTLATLVLACSAPLFAAYAVWGAPGRARRHLLGAAKTLFGFGALALALLGWEILGPAGPWAWLCMTEDGERRTSTGRRLLAALAAWQLLLAYPVAGSQLAFGTFLVLTSGVICAADGVRWIADSLGAGRAGAPARVVAASGLAVAAVVLAHLTWAGGVVARRYQAGTALGFPGTERIRLEPRRARQLQQLVAALEPADVIFATAGLNSLYLWTGRRMPAPVAVANDLRVIPEDDRRRIAQGLERAQRPIVILSPPMKPHDLSTIDLVQWIESHFELDRRIGRYRLMRRRKAESPDA